MRAFWGWLAQRSLPRGTRYRSARITAVLAVLASACLSAGYDTQAGAALPAPTLAKSYTGSAHNLTASQSGVLTLTGITQNGPAIAGTLTFHAPLVGTGPFKGTLTATTVTLTMVPTAASCPSCASVVFSGMLWPIVSMSGTWVAHLKSGGSQNGTWGLGSTWNGTLHSVTTDSTASIGIGALTEGANGDLVGTLVIYPSNNNVFYGGNRGAVATVTGSVQGSAVTLTSNIIHSCYHSRRLRFVGSLSSTGGGMSGTWSFPDVSSCPGNNGIGNGELGVWQVQRSGTQAAV